MANKNKLKPKGHLYISSPTLEGLALFYVIMQKKQLI